MGIRVNHNTSLFAITQMRHSKKFLTLLKNSMNTKQIQNLTKLRQHLISANLPKFNINGNSDCALTECEELFDLPLSWREKPVADAGLSLFGLDEKTSDALFDDIKKNSMREKMGFIPYTGLPSDQYLVAKNIDLFISKDSTEVILNTIRAFLTKYPDMRFTQVLSSLNINKTVVPGGPDDDTTWIEDNFYDTNEELIKRIPDEFRL